ncbi:MAG: glucuronate isomerase, partial [Planctomycetota bacterium]
MSDSLTKTIFDELNSLVLIDPHTHINPHSPASENLADILGYHYYTELAHSAGMPREHIEEPGISPREKVQRLASGLGHLDNTVQLSWLLEAARELFDVNIDRLDESNWEHLYDSAQAKFDQPDWEDEVLRKSGLEVVFLTNDFDDDLQGFDTERYIPCLRTDELVFHFWKAEVRERLAKCSGVEVQTIADFAAAIAQRFEHFVANGVKACAISLPPFFAPTPVEDTSAESALSSILKDGEQAPIDQQQRLSNWVFWKLAENCDQHNLPFDLMIGVN